MDRERAKGRSVALASQKTAIATPGDGTMKLSARRTLHVSTGDSVMNNIVYIVVGAVVIVLFILGFLGFR